jgi:hypothetical protein
VRTYLQQYGKRLPAEMLEQLKGTETRLGS